MEVSFADLVRPKGLPDFFDAMNSRRFFHYRSDMFADFGGLLSWDDIEDLLGAPGAVQDDFRYYMRGRPVDRVLMKICDAQGRFNVDAFRRLADQGISVVGNRLELKLPWCTKLGLEAQNSFGAAARVGFVASYGITRALPLHYDYVDLIILQLHGSKRWDFHGQPIAGSGIQRTNFDAPSEITRSVTLSAGDVLFVPSGLHHSCFPLEPSLHLGILLAWPTGHWLDRLLADAVAEDEVLAEAVRAGDVDILNSQEQRMKSRLATVLQGISLNDAMAKFAEKHLDAGNYGRRSGERSINFPESATESGSGF